MPINLDDLKNISSEEKELVLKELKLKTQEDIDKAFGSGKAAGKMEAEKELGSQLKELQDKAEADKVKKAISEKMKELKLDLSEEDEKEFLEVVGGDPERVGTVAKLMKLNPTEPETDPFVTTPKPGKPGKEGKKVDTSKDDDGNYIDEDLAKMNATIKTN